MRQSRETDGVDRLESPTDAWPRRIGRGRPGPRPGAEPAAREVPGAAGPLLPERPDARAGRRRARVAGGDRAEPPGAGPRAAPRPPHPPGLRALRGDRSGWGRNCPLVPSPPPVSPALVRATVDAADRFLSAASAGALAGLGAGASALYPTLSGSATTLAQGVLTTMALTQLKVIGAGLIAAGMLAGGAGAGAWALASTGAGVQADKPSTKPADRAPAPPTTAPPTPAPSHPPTSPSHVRPLLRTRGKPNWKPGSPVSSGSSISCSSSESCRAKSHPIADGAPRRSLWTTLSRQMTAGLRSRRVSRPTPCRPRPRHRHRDRSRGKCYLPRTFVKSRNLRSLNPCLRCLPPT